MDKLDKYIMLLMNRIEFVPKWKSLFQFMVGKRTGQTVQEAHLSQMDRYFGLTPSLSEMLLCERFEALLGAGYLQKTEKGIRALVEVSDLLFEAPYWEGFLIGRRTEIFFRRLELIIQVLSNRNHKKNQYFPVIRDKDIQHFTKGWLKKYSYSREQIKNELFDWLLNQHIVYPQIYTNRFSGGHYTGQTQEQIYNDLKLSFWDGYFYFLEGIHFLFAKKKNYPCLESIMPPILSVLTFSSRQTYELYIKGLQIEEIAQIRKLKLSTIEDHLVEIKAVFPYMKLTELPSPSTIQEIKSRKWQRLKEIKETFPMLSYFQIRLAIVSKGEETYA